MRRRAILFDMDGTLVDSEPLHQRALADVLEREGVAMPDGYGNASTGLSMPAAYALLRAGSTLQLGYDELVAAKYAAFLAAAGTLQLRAGAAAAVALARGLAGGYAIVSNSDRMLVDAALLATGMQHPGLVSVTRNDVREGKPAPEPYLRAAWLLGMPPADCIVVEDSPAGALAGLAAGMTVLAWPERHRHDLVFPPGVLHCGHDDIGSVLRQLVSVDSAGSSPTFHHEDQDVPG